MPSQVETEAYVPVLKEAKEVLDRIGVTNSINVYTTYGPRTIQPARDSRAVLSPFEPRVDWLGAVSKNSPCPLSPAFQKWLANHYSTLAGARPHYIWADDDFNHLPHCDTSYICYCPRHLKRFGKAIGEREVSRERLVADVFAPGPPHPWRAKWLEVLNQGMVETAAIIEKAVHCVSPDTRVSQMTSAYFNHEIEGRDYPQVLKTFAGSHTPTVRISTSGYWEGELRMLYSQDENLRHAVLHVPEDAERCSEIDNYPNSLYIKSTTWMKAQMRHCCLLNVPHQTLAVHDHNGTELDYEPEVGAMLRQAKPELKEISRMFGGAGQFRGVRMLGHPQIAQMIPLQATLPGPDGFASMGTGWADALRGFGFPIVFSGNEAVTAVTGRVLWAFRDHLDEIFSGGVLLDYSALETLQELGREDLAGVSALRRYEPKKGELPVSGEHLTDPEFWGAHQRFDNIAGKLGVLQPHPGARVVSECINCEGEPVFPGLTAYENKLGGRCCVYAYDFSGDNPPDMFRKGTTAGFAFFYNRCRQEQLSHVIRWLGKDEGPLQVKATGWILPHRVDFPGRIMLAAMNLNLDPWEKVEFSATIPQHIRRVLLVSKGAHFMPVPSRAWKHRNGLFTISVKTHVPTLDLLGVAVELDPA